MSCRKLKKSPLIDDYRGEVIMEYKIVIQENLDNGVIYMRTLPLEPASVPDAMKFRAAHYHSDCIFILQYCLN